MQPFREPLLAAAGLALAIGGGAYAASAYTHHMQVRLPDGQMAQVEYVGDVAPVVVMQPAAVAADPFAGVGSIDRIFAQMQRQHAAMMQQVAQMQAQMAAHAQGVPVSGQSPANRNMHWSYVSSTTSSNGCTQTVEWHSDGTPANGAPAAAPQVIRTSSGTCDKAVKDTPIHAASDVKPQAPVTVGKTI